MRPDFAVLVVAVFGLSGCTVLPSVEYRAIKKASDMDGMTNSYYRDMSQIEIAFLPSGELSIKSTPVEFTEEKLGIKSVVDWRSSTIVTLNKRANTDSISSVDSSVTDNTAKAITDYGGALVKVISLGMSISGQENLNCLKVGVPVVIRNPETKNYSGNDSAKDCIDVKLGAPPVDAIPMAEIPKNSRVHSYYYSACRDAEVTVHQRGTSGGKKTVRIADPSLVQWVQFPVKGTITMHSECGVSVKTDSIGVDNGAAVANALATQAQAVLEALKKGEDAGKK